MMCWMVLKKKQITVLICEETCTDLFVTLLILESRSQAYINQKIFHHYFYGFSTEPSIKVEIKKEQAASDVCVSLHIYSAASSSCQTLCQVDLE